MTADKICEFRSMLNAQGGIVFSFPANASLSEIELTRRLIDLQISTWEAWNKKRLEDQAFHAEFTRWQNDGART